MALTRDSTGVCPVCSEPACSALAPEITTVDMHQGPPQRVRKQKKVPSTTATERVFFRDTLVYVPGEEIPNDHLEGLGLVEPKPKPKRATRGKAEVNAPVAPEETPEAPQSPAKDSEAVADPREKNSSRGGAQAPSSPSSIPGAKRRRG